MSYITIHVDGNSYTSEKNPDASAASVADSLYESLDDLSSWQLALDGGGFALFNKAALARAVIVVRD